jgi:hypothetical protein
MITEELDISVEARLFEYDLANEHWFKPNEHWQLAIANAKQLMPLTKEHQPVLSVAGPAPYLNTRRKCKSIIWVLPIPANQSLHSF